MKSIFIRQSAVAIFVLLFTAATDVKAQAWSRITAIPNLDVFSLTVYGDTIYAGTTDKVYASTDNGTTWTASAGIEGAGFVNTIIIFHNKLFVGTYGGSGIYSSSNLGATWAVTNNGLGLPYITKLLIWDDVLYVATTGDGFYKYNEAANQWSQFNNGFYVNIAGNVNDFTVYNNTLVAAAGANGTFFIYDTTAKSWNNTYYISNTLRPGLIANALLSEGNTLLAGLPGPISQAVLRSEDGGQSWFADSVGLGVDFNRRVALSGVNPLTAGAQKNYAVVNKFGGTNGSNVADIFTRPKGSAAGTQWNLVATFDNNRYAYEIAETSNKLFVALDTGLYYQQSLTLPVTLLNFTAQKQSGGILLQWQTSSQQNASDFNVQRSTDGISFTNIDKQKAAGNSNALLDYNYFDSLNTIVFKPATLDYRMEEFDLNGNVSYSKAISINLTPNSGLIKVIPNPVGTTLNMQTDGDINSAVLRLVDMSGKTVYSAVKNLAAKSTTQINVAALPAGVYILTIQAKGVNENIKVEKQ